MRSATSDDTSRKTAGRSALSTRILAALLAPVRLTTAVSVPLRGRRAALALLAASAVLLATVPLARSADAAATAYPSPPPDFSHPGDPHPATSSFRPSFSVATGHPLGPRPLLVIQGRYSDLDNPPAAEIEQRVFRSGSTEPFGSVRNYLFESSAGRFWIIPAKESSGAPDDGVVTVDLGTFEEYEAKPEAERTGMVLDAINPFVNVAQYDANDDDRITGDELGILFIKTALDPTNNCGQNWAIPPTKELDGKTLRVMLAMATSASNQMTWIHELGHQTLGMEDLYLDGIGNTALGGTTCASADNPAENLWRFPNAYERLHWGWQSQPSPLVVTRDGYHVLSSGTAMPFSAPHTRILYDPAKGTDHYFMVEYRQRKTGTYDEGVSDTGLLIWRVNDTRWPPTVATDDLPVNVLVRPDPSKGEQAADAWDPSDTKTPQRTMVAPWDDGTPSRLAVRAIGAAGDQNMRVYLDVRGPGVLVDPSDAKGRPLQFDMIKGETTEISFPVMNTGEETDTFDFAVVDGDIPNAVETTHRMTLAAGQQATAKVKVTVPAEFRTGPRSARVRGRSTTDPGVVTDAPFVANIVKRPVSVTYTGVHTAQYSDPARLSARVTDRITGDPLAGKTVRFTLAGHRASAVTDANGVARTSIVVEQPAGAIPLHMEVSSDDLHTGGEEVVIFTVEREDLTFDWTGSTNLAHGGDVVLEARAVQQPDGSPGDLSLASATFTLTPTLTTTPYVLHAGVDADGVATASLPEDLPVDLWTVGVEVPGGNKYWRGEVAEVTELVVFDPAGLATAGAQGLDTTGARISIELGAKYADNVPTGEIRVRSSAGRFVGRSLDWLVVVGNQAILQTRGSLGGETATTRLRLADLASPGIGSDTFDVTVRDATGAARYASGLVVIDRGDLHVGRS